MSTGARSPTSGPTDLALLNVQQSNRIAHWARARARREERIDDAVRFAIYLHKNHSQTRRKLPKMWLRNGFVPDDVLQTIWQRFAWLQLPEPRCWPPANRPLLWQAPSETEQPT